VVLIIHELVKILGGVIDEIRIGAIIVRMIDHTFGTLLTEIKAI
jgi:hypothetical protein